jgi:hypothetical protein
MSMRRLVIVCAGVCAFAAPALAGPKDQTKMAMIGRQAVAGNATVNNATTDFKVATKGCKMQLKAKGLSGLSDGDVIICTGGADVLGGPFVSPAGNTIVITGEAKAGQVKIKADLTEIGCGSSDVIQFNGSFACYLDDAPYRSTDAGVGSWADACTAATGIPLVNAAAAPDTLKANPTQRVVLGVCQAFTGGVRINPPTGAEIAVDGGRQFTVAP